MLASMVKKNSIHMSQYTLQTSTNTRKETAKTKVINQNNSVYFNSQNSWKIDLEPHPLQIILQ